MNEDTGSAPIIRFQHCQSYCHLIDWEEQTVTLVISGHKLSTDELDDRTDKWERAELVNTSFMPGDWGLEGGRSIGMFTDFYSVNLNSKETYFPGDI